MKNESNNIDCPFCGSDECYVNEIADGVQLYCKSCGRTEFQPHEYEADGFCDICEEDKPTRNIRKDDFVVIDACKECIENEILNLVDCPTCEGAGELDIYAPHLDEWAPTSYPTCANCGGTGKVQRSDDNDEN